MRQRWLLLVQWLQEKDHRTRSLAPIFPHSKLRRLCIVIRQGFQPEPAELGSFAQQHLEDYKVPERFVILSDLPKIPTGKVHRLALKGMLQSTAAIAS